MRHLGLDIGDARVGVAVSDPTGRVATPLDVLDARGLLGDVGPLRRLVEEYGPGVMVVGLPLSLSGEEGPQARAVRETVERYAKTLDIPVRYWDERLSSAEARRIMTSSGVSDRKKRGTLDKLAAALILQSYLDAHVVRVMEGDSDE
ncbi:MAG: Holliday junction resolvase RuvX [Coriobacteriia bacterium]|nr:Holliday junction resolvase RuvX [Coriobacteriia bacterium]